MKSAIRSGLMVLGVAGALTLVLTVASAQEDSREQPATAEQTERPHRRGPGRMVEAVAEALGVSRGEVVKALAQGETPAELAAANGSSGEALEGALLAQLTEQLEQAVADGKIDQDRADEILTKAGERIDAFVNNPHQRRAARAVRHQALAVAADVIGITPEELKAQLAGGATLVEAAAGEGLSEQQLVDGLLGPIEDRLDRAVANGRLTQEQADERLAEMRAELIKRINQPLQRRG